LVNCFCIFWVNLYTFAFISLKYSTFSGERQGVGFRLQEARAAGFDDAYIYEKQIYGVLAF